MHPRSKNDAVINHNGWYLIGDDDLVLDSRARANRFLYG